MAQRNPAYIIPPFPEELIPQNVDPVIWGISFDIYLRRSTDPPPNGWGSHSAYVYSKLRSFLREHFFIPSQYSDYRSMYPCGAWFCWNVMFRMMEIQPPGRMETTVKKLKMHSIVELGFQDVSDGVRLGGVFSRHVRGPMPVNLVGPVAQYLIVPANQPLVHPVPAQMLPPVGTRPSAQALNPFNWIG